MLIRTVAILAALAVVMSDERAPLDKDTKQAVMLYNNFGEKIYRVLSLKEGNIFMSPVSVSAVVGMIHLGARGQTAKEIEDVLEMSRYGLSKTTLSEAVRKLIVSLTPTVKDFDLHFANGVFVTEGLSVNRRYRDDLQKYYTAGLYSTPLKEAPEEAVTDLNNWVKDQTNGRIPVLLERPLPPTLPIVVLNAVYFQGKWKHPFPKDKTKKDKFHGFNKMNDVDLMYQEGYFHHVENKYYQAVELPYMSEDIVMVVVLPKSTKDLYRLEQGLSYSQIRDELGSVIKQKVHLTLPRFSLSLAYDLRGPLQDVGLNSVFSPNFANLTGIASRPVLALNTIYHKALVDVNEKGTEALATTSGITQHSSLTSPEVAEFRADRPFIFLIEEVNSNAVLFVGRVSDL
ncbi:hypothetical protein BIW11_02348 [Tropilaelaps mercedesae]|uniref:Serpin domain-containing protein n=1 Tax=Tropilaelaps mercedesae TaxID=418985 RepID=A0A1V9WZ13_9ACAR|nr:hypothetical protein BIW11_02348 [Tropilaelaps mercedesae]